MRMWRDSGEVAPDVDGGDVGIEAELRGKLAAVEAERDKALEQLAALRNDLAAKEKVMSKVRCS